MIILVYLESVLKGGIKRSGSYKKMVHQVISDGQRDVIFISYLHISMNTSNCKSAVIAFITAAVLLLSSPTKQKLIA